MEALRQPLWEDADGDPKDTMEEGIQTDKVRLIDTSAMVADPLTKSMHPERMEEMMRTNILDLQPTPESLNAKMLKQKQRLKKTAEKSSTTNDSVTV